MTTSLTQHTPTQEQQAILDAFATGESMVVEALAGSGKTTVLKMLSRSAPERTGLYLCYNAATAKEAKASFPSNTSCLTAHSLAYRAVGYRYRDRLNAKRRPPWEIASELGIHASLYIDQDVSLTPMFLAGRVMETIKHFCYSSSEQPESHHVPHVSGAEHAHDKIVDFVLPRANKVWEDLQKEDGFFPFSHDCYLKIYSLTKPRLDYDFILIDEAQDSNSLTLQIFQNQKHAQLIAVGDDNQSLYGWRGAVNAMDKLQFAHRLTLSKSFRFGPAVAAEGQKWLKLLGCTQTLEGYDAITSQLGKCESPDAVLCRTNATVLEEAMAARMRGESFAIVGGVADIEKMAKAATDLQSGKRTLHPDIAAFDTWAKVQEYSLTSEGSDLRTVVRMIDEHGPQALISLARDAVLEDYADVVLSTGHRAKGREWNRVRIAGDFESTVNEEGKMVPEVMRLAYVAVTRAQHLLDRSGLAFVDQLLDGTYLQSRYEPDEAWV